MNIRAKAYLIAAMILMLLAMGTQAWSKDDDHRLARDISNSITPFLIMGELSLATDGDAAQTEMVQGAKALIVTAAITQALKYTIREKRPNSDALNSFPSGHTSAAFAMATVIGDYKPTYGLLAYGTATAIGVSRVEVGAHYWHDVIAGAAIGYFTAKHFTKRRGDSTPTCVSINWKL